MSIKLDLYQIFCEVAQAESFSKAARALYMTQPAVSRSIHQLESALDTRLFTRTPKGVTLTQEGHLIYEHARSAISLLEVGEEKLQEVKGLLMGELKIGVGDTITKSYLLPFLDTFHKTYPNIKLKVVNRTTLELIELLKLGQIDLALCNLPIEVDGIITKNCLTIQDIFVAGQAFKSRLELPITLEALSALPLIFLEPKANSRRYVEQYLLQKGFTVTPEIELGSHDLLLALAQINLGLSCVIREFSKETLEQDLVFEVTLTEPIPKRHIGVCHLEHVPLSPSAKRFYDLLLPEA